MADLGFTLSARGLRALVAELDNTREGLISFPEFVMWYDAEVKKAVERERLRRIGWRSHYARLSAACTLPPRVRIAIAWLLMWSIFTALALLAVIYSRVLGASTTRLMLLSWGLAQAQSYTVEEPILILLAMLLPWIIDSLTSNELSGQICGSFVTVFVNTFVAPLKAVAGKLRGIIFPN